MNIEKVKEWLIKKFIGEGQTKERIDDIMKEQESYSAMHNRYFIPNRFLQEYIKKFNK